MTYDCHLYLLTPPALPAGFDTMLKAALDAGEVAALQLRLKHVSDDEVRRAVDLVRPIAQSRGVALILNDRPDLAVATGCDGAHVGEEDGPVAEARKILGPHLQLGVSCYHSRDLAMQAGEAGADYVAFGAFFPSVTKETGHRADFDLLSWWSELMELPVVAIGGITPENCAPLVRAGANFLAVTAAVWSHPEGPAAGVRAINSAIAAA
jgi:thiamine-phosphate pyrophosphorylase